MTLGFEPSQRFESLTYGMPPCLYVAAFDGGIVKVGASRNIKTRLYHLRAEGSRKGHPMIRWDIFGPMLDETLMVAESEVIHTLAQRYENIPNTAEWFVGCDFDDAFMVCKEVVCRPIHPIEAGDALIKLHKKVIRRRVRRAV